MPQTLARSINTQRLSSLFTFVALLSLSALAAGLLNPFQPTAYAGGGNALALSNAAVADNPGTLAFSSASYKVTEADAVATITFKRTGGTDNQVVGKVTLNDVTTSPSDYRFALGAKDTTFNPAAAGANGSVDSLALQPDGKIIIGGNFTEYNLDAAAPDRVLRLNTDGTRDTTFNPGGTGADSFVYALAVQPDGKIVIGGTFTSYNGDAAAPDYILRLNADGTRDTTFNPGGAGADSLVYSVALQPDGRSIVGGQFTSYNGDASAPDYLIRLNADGTRDATFNPGGTGANLIVIATAVLSDGKIIIGGSFSSYNGDFAANDYVMRLNADGTRDAGFNPSGSGADGSVYTLRVQPDGKIVLGGLFTIYDGDATAPDRVLRLNAVGTRDISFNAGGTGVDSPVLSEGVEEVALQPDGKIIIVGEFNGYNGDVGAPDRVIRLNADGTRDTTFNVGGAGANNSVEAMALQPDGKIVIGGLFTNYNGGSIPGGVMRLVGTPFVRWQSGDATDKVFQLPIVNDGIVEADETLALTLEVVSGGATLGSPNSSTLTIGRAEQTLSFNTHAPANATYNTSFTVAATSNSGLTVSYSSSGICTNVGATYTMNGGTGTCTVKVDQAGDNLYYPAAQLTETVTAQKAVQTINFSAPANKTFGDADFTVSATAGSGLSVSFAAGGQCTVTDSTVHLTGAGSCTITASQAGSDNFNAAPVIQRTFQIAKATTATAVNTSANPSVVGQSVTFTATVNSAAGTPTGSVQFKVDNVDLGTPVALGVGGTASVSTDTLTAGSHAVTAVYSGDANFATSNGFLFNGGQWAVTFSLGLSFKSEGNEPNDLDFLVSMSPAINIPVTVNYTTVDGTAVAPSDYEAKSGSLFFLPGDSSKRLTIRINGDTAYEETEEFFIDVSLPGKAPAARGRGLIINDDPTGGVIEFEQATYNVAEGGSLTVKVKRAIWNNLPVDVDYTTDDGSIPSVFVPCAATTGLALDRCDFTKALGTLHFAQGETEKTFTLLIGQDSYVEGAETFQLKLSNPRGNAALGPKSAATVTIADDSPEPNGNSIDDTDNFIRQHYLDFLNREPDASGFQFWRNGIASCGVDVGCREVKRIDTSAAFFLSIEFQETGYLVYRIFKTAYGDATSPNVPGTVPVIRFNEFMPDTQRIGQGVIVGANNWQAQLEANKQAYTSEFVQRQRFLASFPSTLTATEFVSKLDVNAGGVLSEDEKAQLVASLGASPADAGKRVSVLRQVAEHASLRQHEFNRAFVLMQFYGYLRRNPDDAPDADFRGWRFWLDKLEEFGGDYRRAEMVKAFILSDEYRKRFGQ